MKHLVLILSLLILNQQIAMAHACDVPLGKKAAAHCHEMAESSEATQAHHQQPGEMECPSCETKTCEQEAVVTASVGLSIDSSNSKITLGENPSYWFAADHYDHRIRPGPVILSLAEHQNWQAFHSIFVI